MPQVINRPPVGLTSILDSKANGRAPGALLDEVRATVELLDLYGLGQRQSLQEQINNPVLGPQAFTTSEVPEGELWRVLNLTVLIAANAGGVTAGGVGYFDPTVPIGGGVAFYALHQDRATVGAAAGVTQQGWQGSMFWLPGYAAAGWIANNSANADSITLRMQFERYRL